MGIAAAYADTRVRIIELVRSCDDAALDTIAPATPAWSVRDLVAHVTGLAVDVANGHLEGVGSDEWTQAQVEARRGQPIDAVLSEWEAAGAQIESTLDDWPGLSGSFVVGDLATHEQDIRGALGRPGGVGSPGFDIALQLYVASIDRRLRKRQLPSLRITAGTDEWLLGDGDPVATLALEPHELFRAVTGRRSRAQLAAYGWAGDATPFLDAISQYGLAEHDVIER